MCMRAITSSFVAAIVAASFQVSAAQAAPVRALPRVRLPATESEPSRVRSAAEICLTAARARERNSPAGPGLQAQCEARVNAEREAEALRQNAPRQPQPDAGQNLPDAYPRERRQRAVREPAQFQTATAEAAAAEAQARAADAARQAEELRKVQSLEAGNMVKSGNCEGAQQYALSVGNFALAQQIKDYCAK